MANSDSQAELVLELAEEFLDRYRKGERPPLREYIDRHPELAAEIKEIFPAMAMLENIAVVDESMAEQGGLAAAVAPPLQQLGDYRIIREIGHGGMGVVYEAEQISLGRYVALKVLPHKALADEKTKKRFQREAKAAAKLHHTNIVPVFGVGEHEGLPYYAMQFIQGLSVDLVLEELKRIKDRGGDMGQVASLAISSSKSPGASKRDLSAADMARSLMTGEFQPVAASSPEGGEAGAAPPEGVHSNASTAKSSRSASSDSMAISSSSIALPGQAGSPSDAVQATPSKRKTYWHSVAQTGVQVADALEYAHKQGIIHRDIKPSNLLLDTSGTVWVTDFGLAKADDHQDITHAGDVLGTLRYMPPEAFDGKADGRGDVYSLGLTLYELLAFRPAFDEKERNRLVKRVTTEEPARLNRLNRDVPRDLVTIVHKAIARDPGHRYQTPGELAEDLKRFVEDRPVRARRISETERLWRWCRRNPLSASLLAGIVLVFLVGFAGVFSQWREAESAREEEKIQRGQAVVQRRGAEAARDEADKARAASEKSRDVAEAQRQSAEAARDEANQARAASEKSRLAAEAETYRALLSEVRALRSGHEPGWREKALSGLARLAVMPTPRRDLPELRTEAAAALGTPDIRLVAKIELPSEDLGGFSFSPDGRTLVTVGIQRGLDFWDVPGNAHRSFAKGLAVSQTGFDLAVYLSDGRGLAVGTREQGVVFTDEHGVRTPREPITQGKSRPTKLSIDSKGQRIAVAWTDGAGITVHDVASGALLDSFKNSAAPFALSPDGQWLARAENLDIVLLPVASKASRIVLGRDGGTAALAFSLDGTMLAAALRDTTVIWDVVKREQIGTLRHRERVLELAFSPDGEWIATAGLDYTARIWETRTGQRVASLPSFAPVRRVKWSPTGEYLAMSTRHSAKDVYLYKITGRRHVQQWLTGHKVELLGVAAHPRLDRLATSGYTELMSWDLSQPNPVAVALQPNPGAVTALAYNHDGALLATASWLGSKPKEILIRDSNSGKVRNRITGPLQVWALAFDPTGERIACGDAAGNVVVWDYVTTSPVHQFKTGGWIRSIAFLDRPLSVVSHGKDAVFLFNLESKKERKVEFAGEVIRSLAVDRSGSRVVVGFQSGTIASLSVPELTSGPRFVKAHKGSVECMALSPDGRVLATGGVDHHVVLRDAKSLEPLLGFPPWAGELRNMTFDFKGRRLAVVGTDSDVDFWDLAVLRDGLAEVGLAWDRPAPAVVAAPDMAPERDHPRSTVPVIRSVPAQKANP